MFHHLLLKVRGEKGQVAVLTALMLSGLLIMAGLALDLGMVSISKSRLQHATDLAALAGSQELLDNPANAVSKTKDYGRLNGIPDNQIQVTTPFEGNDKKIYVEATKDVGLSFMPIVGKHTTWVKAAATVEVTPGTYSPVFNYLFFSGATEDKLEWLGSENYVLGKIHANQDLKLSGKKNVFIGGLEVAGKLDVNNDNLFLPPITSSSVIKLPNYDLRELKNQASLVFTDDVRFHNLTIDGIIFVEGKVEISRGKVTGNGLVVATKDIRINDNSIIEYEKADQMIGFYSLANITINSDESTLHGVFYAPNGEIEILSNRSRFRGAFIGRKIRMPGKENFFYYDPQAKQALSGKTAQTRLIK